jgi:hypothetical protein
MVSFNRLGLDLVAVSRHGNVCWGYIKVEIFLFS